MLWLIIWNIPNCQPPQWIHLLRLKPTLQLCISLAAHLRLHHKSLEKTLLLQINRKQLLLPISQIVILLIRKIIILMFCINNLHSLQKISLENQMLDPIFSIMNPYTQHLRFFQRKLRKWSSLATIQRTEQIALQGNRMLWVPSQITSWILICSRIIKRMVDLKMKILNLQEFLIFAAKIKKFKIRAYLISNSVCHKSCLMVGKL